MYIYVYIYIYTYPPRGSRPRRRPRGRLAGRLVVRLVVLVALVLVSYAFVIMIIITIITVIIIIMISMMMIIIIIIIIIIVIMIKPRSTHRGIRVFNPSRLLLQGLSRGYVFPTEEQKSPKFPSRGGASARDVGGMGRARDESRRGREGSSLI